MYEQLLLQLHECDQTFLTSRHLERYMSHPFNVLQYYQVAEKKPSSINMPVILKTQFQMFGSLYDNPYENMMDDHS